MDIETFDVNGNPVDSKRWNCYTDAVQASLKARLTAAALASLAAAHLGWTPSVADMKRLLRQGAVELNQGRVAGVEFDVRPGDVVRIGKHRFFRVTPAGG